MVSDSLLIHGGGRKVPNVAFLIQVKNEHVAANFYGKLATILNVYAV